jgi:hypothetical protein
MISTVEVGNAAGLSEGAWHAAGLIHEQVTRQGICCVRDSSPAIAVQARAAVAPISTELAAALQKQWHGSHVSSGADHPHAFLTWSVAPPAAYNT